MARPPYFLMLTLALMGAVLSGCPVGPDDPEPTTDDIVLSREHLVSYEPGGTIAMTVEIDVREGLDISAIALVENIPPGWVYVSASHDLGALPAIRPQQGTEDTLNFVWIQPPFFPYTFTYTLGIPLNATGAATITGHVEYREGSGDAQVSDTLRSTIQGP